MDLTTHNAFKLYVGLAAMSHASEPYMPFDGEDERITWNKKGQGYYVCSSEKEFMPGAINKDQLKEPESLNKRINILNKRLGLTEREAVIINGLHG